MISFFIFLWFQLHDFNLLDFTIPPDKRGIDTHLNSVKKALIMQEQTIRQNESERKVLCDKVDSLERCVNALESEKRQLLERIAKMKMNENKVSYIFRFNRF